VRPNWFVGLPVDAGTWLEPLLADAPRGLHHVHPDDLHLTVAFFGGVDEEQAMRGWAVSERVKHAPISVRLSGLAPMGNPRRPTALSVVLGEGRDETIALIAEIKDDMLAAAQVRPDTRAIKPHVTVARPPRKASNAERRRAVTWAEGVTPIGAAVTLDRIALYTWSDDRRERKFRVVVDRALAGG
jgi:2'-5' RNA ligase